MKISIRLFSLLLLFFLNSTVSAQVQSFEESVGHKSGERITQNYQVVQYLSYLEQASDRVVIRELGTTFNNKKQLVAIVTHPDNHARLDEIRINALRLDDARETLREQADQIIENQPVILYLAGSIHGFELSGSEGVLRLLEHFTTSNDPETMEQLRNTVLILDPVINPDGRDAFAHFNHEHKGRTANPKNIHWSNDFTSWDALKYRTGHYYFDLNRDWFAHTHPETRNRAAFLREWRPQASVDAHEMGSEREFYLDPPTDPVSPWFPSYASKWFREYGKAHAGGFDLENIEYTTGEIFNFFYPAYFTSYMTYQGSVGMLYEQGSSRGFALELSDGTVRTLSDAAFNQFAALRSMVRMSSERREEILSDYYSASLESVEKTEGGAVRYLIKNEGDPHHVTETVNLLIRNGIEVHRLNSETEFRNVSDREGNPVGNQSFGPGTYLVVASQPRMRFIRMLLEPHIQIPEEFLAEARERVNRGENPRFYDITSWSLPLMFNLQGFSTSDSKAPDAALIAEKVINKGGAPSRKATYAYLIDGSQSAMLSAVHPLREHGIRLHILYKPTQVNGKSFSSGTLVVRTDGNEDQVHTIVSELAEKYRLRVDPVDSGLSDPGFPPLGSIEGNRVQKPKIAILGDHPVNAYSFGWAWHKLDQQYEIPHTIIRPGAIGNSSISDFNVLIMPEIRDFSEMDKALGENGIERIKQWVQDGGSLVTLSTATEYSRKNLELSTLVSWYEKEENEKKQKITVPGAFFSIDTDSESWLNSGYSFTPPMLINSDRLYEAADEPPMPSKRIAVKVSENENARISGHAWQENLERLPGSVLVYEERIGSGRIINFTEDTNFRGYWRGADRLFLNAVVLSPGAP
ncbi:MAG TPA: M14 family zinc carboxypeptidase [Balneolaceae bacterium]|nr:M14 family zinc carboxypeptidase [Balneolaceae bacterium]